MFSDQREGPKRRNAEKGRVLDHAFVLACAVAACLPIFRSGIFQGHDWSFELVRVAEYVHSLRGGVLPVRWGADLYGGYGSPIYIFFPPVFLTIAGVFALLGLTFVNSVKLALFLLTLAGGMGMYWFAKCLFGRTGGVLAACLYVLAPYHFVDAFVRSAFSEFTALCIAPFVFYGLWEVFMGERVEKAQVVFSLAAAMFALSHNLSVLMYAPIVFFYVLALVLSTGRWDRIKPLLMSSAVALCLASFFAIPVLFEKRYVQLWRAVAAEKFEVVRNLVSFGSLVRSESWYSVTPFTPVLAALVTASLVLGRRKMEKPVLACSLAFATLIACYAVLMTPLSAALWRNAEFLKILQFPWRLLSPVTFMLCALSGGIVSLAGQRRGLREVLAAGVVTAGAIFLLLQYPAGGAAYATVTDAQLSAKSIKERWLRATVTDEYLPVWVLSNPHLPGREKLQSLGAGANVKTVLVEPDSMVFNVSLPEGSRMRADVFYFPGWEVRSDGEKIPVDISPQGHIEFFLPPGDHRVVVRFDNTPVRTISEAVSLLGLLGLGWLVFSARLSRRRKDR